jgi:hypothetical protein
MDNKLLCLILALFVVVATIAIFWTSNEGFTNLTPGNFPMDVNVPVLYEEYPLKTRPGISMNNYETNSSYYPIFGSSYNQYTNNVRYWATPDNGKCSPAEFCGGLYNDKKLEISNTPRSIPFSNPDIRVNYYASHPSECPSE